MEVNINLNNDSPKYVQIYEQLKNTIVTKKLPAHSKLPSKRHLAENLSVSVHTVKEAYEQLDAEGFIYSKERSGYFVSPFEFEWQQIKETKATQPVTETSPVKTDIDFHNGHVDASSFPFTSWRKLFKKYLQPENLVNSPWQGEPTLRFEIAQYVQRSRGVQCDSSQVFIFGGTQHQLQALCLFFGPTSIAGIEEPGFKRARAIFQQYCYHTYHIAVDKNGVTVPTQKIDFLYTTPAHQFPLGMVMSADRRAALLHWAQKNNTYIIEDDYDSEYRFKGQPFPSLAKMDQLQQVIYSGTFSKTLIPSIRISYLILPSSLVEAFTNFYKDQKSVVSKIDQLILADFITQGLFDKHLAKMRTLYRKKQIALITAIKTHLPSTFQIIGEKSGLHIVLKLPNTLSEKEAIQKALGIGVCVYPSSTSYYKPSAQQMIILGYGGLSFEQIEEGILRLKKVWD
ncbi:PLP-dependent aminotransferase family protein [Rummeliibacillus sp. POC4]|uniref:MocR-like pyridoxine biosynthesis transcription factor PdxR n=1 Tax=Rummeliibacillus sp. POC4 TaxID=2305899 RepID=UPI000E66554E|nr:PLP-dependent aminotransferase family protein [Rummeliibacillus sp. POC4]RIJ63809.1 PLP-dependent aminotransferase family protein [Rummeliibacillus sp. POC4]